MFDSTANAAAQEDDRRELLRKAFFIVPPAFSANSRWKWALGALVYGYVTAAATLLTAIYVIVDLGGNIH